MQNVIFYEIVYNNYLTNSIREIHAYSFEQIPLKKIQNVYLNENEEVASVRYLSRQQMEDWFLPGYPFHFLGKEITKTDILNYFLSCKNTLEEYPNTLDEIRNHLLHKDPSLWKKLQKALIFSSK